MSAALAQLSAHAAAATRALLAERKPAGLHAKVWAAVERPLLAAVLAHARGNRSEAARLLGLTRNTLRKKAKLHGLEDA